MKSKLRKLFYPVLAYRDYLKLPAPAKAVCRKDRAGLPPGDPGPETAIAEGISWLARAQDNSVTHDGGVAHSFSLITSWSASYPETTGYIVPTLLEYAKQVGDGELRLRAKRMLDWLLSLQLPDGGFPGGLVDMGHTAPVTFNTGQILFGLVWGVREFGDGYREPMRRTADWLVKTQDPDGCWRRYPSPFTEPGDKVYETHVAWSLLETAEIELNRGYTEAALANIRWALGHQHDNGMFDNCCLARPDCPLTHTLGYALRGIIEGFRFTGDMHLLTRAMRTADQLARAVRLEDGYLPGRLDRDFKGAVRWSCLTGSSQIAACLLLLYQLSGDTKYREAAFALNGFVRRTISISGPVEVRGAVKGTFPVYGSELGGYLPYTYPNWACKFTVDSNMLEIAARQSAEQPGPKAPPNQSGKG